MQPGNTGDWMGLGPRDRGPVTLPLPACVSSPLRRGWSVQRVPKWPTTCVPMAGSRGPEVHTHVVSVAHYMAGPALFRALQGQWKSAHQHDRGGRVLGTGGRECVTPHTSRDSLSCRWEGPADTWREQLVHAERWERQSRCGVPSARGHRAQEVARGQCVSTTRHHPPSPADPEC